MLHIPTPFHPVVVHFPLALFTTALGLEILGWISRKKFLHQCAVCLYVLAAIVAPLVVRTGLWEAERLHLGHPLLIQHQTFALWTMWTALMSLPILWFFYHKFPPIFRVLFVLCLINSAILVSLTGDRGGRMVYEYDIGVEE